VSRFAFYKQEKSKRCARAAVDRLLAEMERYSRNRDFGTLTLKLVMKEGEPDSFIVTDEVSVRADSLIADDERSVS